MNQEEIFETLLSKLKDGDAYVYVAGDLNKELLKFKVDKLNDKGGDFSITRWNIKFLMKYGRELVEIQLMIHNEYKYRYFDDIKEFYFSKLKKSDNVVIANKEETLDYIMNLKLMKDII